MREETEDQFDRTDSGASSRGAVAALAVILVVAAVLRLYNLGADSLWDNEILSLQRAKTPLSDVVEVLRAGTHPPLYSQGVLRPLFVVGQNEFVQRFPSAVFGVLAVAGVYVLGRRVFDVRVGLLASALLAVLPLHVYYSREGRMYALLALLVTAWIASLLYARRKNTIGAWIVYAVLGASILYTHYYAGLTIAAVILVTGAAVLTGAVGPSVRRRWLAATGVIGVLFLPWLPSFLYQFENSSSNIPGRQPGDLPDIVSQFFTAFVAVSSPVRAIILGSLAVLAALLVLAAARMAQRAEHDLFPLLVMVAAVVGTIVLAVLVSVVEPILFVRYFAGILPIGCILLAAAAVRGRPRVLGWAAFGALAAVSVACVIPVVTDSWRPDFGAVTETVGAESSDDAIMLVIGNNQNDLALSGLDHYIGDRVPIQVVDTSVGDSAVPDAIAAQGADSDIWLLQPGSTPTLAVPEGFVATVDETYDTRFFERRFRMRLTLLEPVA